MKKYDPKSIEAKWRQTWEETGLYRVRDDDPRPKLYYLVEFPYTSGEGMHTGHVRGYTALDIMSRQKRMENHNVLYPLGWDAFGLPTENYAIKSKTAPQKITERNIKHFRHQAKSVGWSFDWQREVNTSDPGYYKWTQWIFLQFFKAGLAYQDEIPINWCPKCKTGLANEEVVDGKHERCGTPVTKKLLKQWLLKITAYADRLIEDLKKVDYLPRVAAQQINWIGRSEGATIMFNVQRSTFNVEVFTTRPDTLGGATFLVLAPEHPLVEKITAKEQKAAVEKYLKQVESETELERQEQERPKTGIWTGAYAINPINNEKIPIWVADYVLMTYGTGAIMAVPAHDQRDFEFAKNFDLPIRNVIEPVTGTPQENPEFRPSIVALVRNPKDGKLLSLNWGPDHGGHLFIGGGREGDEDPVECAKREVAEETGYQKLKFIGRTGKIHHHYYAHSKAKARQIEAIGIFFELENEARDKQRLEKDEAGKFIVEWLSVEQADSKIQDQLHRRVLEHFILGKPYVGEGPLCNTGQPFDGLVGNEAKRVIVEHLFKQGRAKGAVKYKLRDWIFSRQHYWGEPIPIIHCPQCGPVPVPDDQLPVELPEVEHYEPTETGESPLAGITEWVNIKCPSCNSSAKRETDTMPNWAGSSWYFLRYLDPTNDQTFADMEKQKMWLPVDLYNGGMEHTTLHLLYSRFWHKFLYDQKLVPGPEPYAKRRSHGYVLGEGGVKMSKSLGNVIDPMDTIKDYGADTLRVYEMFMGPYDEVVAWSTETIAGAWRFLNRVWKLAQELRQTSGGNRQATDAAFESEIDRMTHKTIKKVTEDIQAMHFNTMVSALMEYVNFLMMPDRLNRLRQMPPLTDRSLRAVILLIAPSAPHLAEELWQQLGEKESVHIQGWPKYDPALIKEELAEIVLQVNGKLRGTITLPMETGEEELKKLATQQDSVQRHLKGQKVAKTIVVPRRLVNFVTRN